MKLGRGSTLNLVRFNGTARGIFHLFLKFFLQNQSLNNIKNPIWGTVKIQKIKKVENGKKDQFWTLDNILIRKPPPFIQKNQKIGTPPFFYKKILKIF
jgi:hypothetical protein